MPQRPEPLLPLGLRLCGRRVVVVGGGPVGLRRVGALLAADALVTLVAPRAVVALEDLAGRGRILWHRRPYESGDLHEAWLAVACTADPAVVLTSLATIAGRGTPPGLHSSAVTVIGAVAAFAAG